MKFVGGFIMHNTFLCIASISKRLFFDNGQDEIFTRFLPYEGEQTVLHALFICGIAVQFRFEQTFFAADASDKQQRIG